MLLFLILSSDIPVLLHQIKVTDPNSNPVKRKTVYLTVTYGNNINSVQTLITNDVGIAQFSLDTEPWGLQPVSLKVGGVLVKFFFSFFTKK